MHHVVWVPAARMLALASCHAATIASYAARSPASMAAGTREDELVASFPAAVSHSVESGPSDWRSSSAIASRSRFD
jgi:hypothetical protein